MVGRYLETSAESIDMGANLSVLGPWDDHSQPLFGSNDWAYVSFASKEGKNPEAGPLLIINTFAN
jgi:hypothetical protein